MPVPPPTPARSRLQLPLTSWIGLIGTLLFGLIALASSGFWSMLAMVALVVLLTALYGVAFRRTTWLRLPRKRAAAGLAAGIAIVALFGSSAAGAATEPAVQTAPRAVVAADATPRSTESTPTRHATPTPTPTPTPVITTETVVETSAVPFAATEVQDATLPSGTSSITTAGVAGVRTKTWTVTYQDGVETRRTLTSERVTTPPVTEVTTVGTYVEPAPAAPSCQNGSYVNSAGTTVCRPEQSSSAPSGATAQCVDGAWSFSQSRRGTCSSHGGVARWL